MKWFKRLMVIALLLVVGGWCAGYFWSKRVAQRTDRWMAVLREKGEKFALDELGHARKGVAAGGVRVERGNRYRELQSACDRVDKLLHPEQANSASSLQGRLVIPGMWEPTWTAKEMETAGGDVTAWRTMETRVRQAMTYVRTLEASLTNFPADTSSDYGELGLTGSKRGELNLETWFRVGQGLCDVTMMDLRQTNATAAARRLTSSVRLMQIPFGGGAWPVDQVRHRGQVVASQVRGTWNVLHAGGASEEALHQLQSELGRQPLLPAFLSAMEVNRAVALQDFARVAEGGAVSGGIGASVLQKGILAYYRLVGLQADREHYLLKTQPYLDCVRDLQRGAVFGMARNRLGGMGRPSALMLAGVPIAPALISARLPGMEDEDLDALILWEAQRRLAVTALAIKRYELKQRRLPAALSDLVPDFLTEVPQDPVDRETLRYRLVEGAGFVLYSVGVDGKDDGGDPFPTGEWEPWVRWSMVSGKDLVWPQRAAAHTSMMTGSAALERVERIELERQTVEAALTRLGQMMELKLRFHPDVRAQVEQSMPDGLRVEKAMPRDVFGMMLTNYGLAAVEVTGTNVIGVIRSR